MLQKVKPTRMELLRLKKRINIARKGLDLLKLKRAALIIEFMKYVHKSKDLREQLEKITKKAYEDVKIAEIYHGTIGIESATMMIKRMAKLNIKTKNVMGINLPILGKERFEDIVNTRYRLVGFSAKIDQIINDFEKYHNLILEIAEVENSIRKLLQEIEKTNRRSNAIEKILIPELEKQASYLKMKFEEMERDTFVTLKKIKSNLSKRENAEAMVD